jgi:DNA-binding NtrC family response regulator
MSPLASTSTTAVAVVIVDPDADNLAMYETFFESMGWEVSPVDNASAALARLGVAPRPLAVIFDFWLRDMTALAFCQAIGALTGDGPPVATHCRDRLHSFPRR